MTVDFNSSDIDAVSLCNLALETSSLCAETNFQNTDLMIRAIAYFLESIEIEPRNYKAHLGLGLMLMAGRMYEDAIGHLETAYEINPVPEINKYIESAEVGKTEMKTSFVETAISKKKHTVNDLLDLGNKFKIK
jgi:tetratricopeptide (TPR) repeat protein